MKFAVHQLSCQGGREKNEDRMGYSYTREAVLLVLADGMGGHPKGEVAAQLAVQTVSELFHRQALPQRADQPLPPVRLCIGSQCAEHEDHLLMHCVQGRGWLEVGSINEMRTIRNNV